MIFHQPYKGVTRGHEDAWVPTASDDDSRPGAACSGAGEALARDVGTVPDPKACGQVSPMVQVLLDGRAGYEIWTEA